MRICLAMLAAVLLAPLPAGPVRAEQAPKKVTIAAGSTAGFYSLPLTVTSRLGLFKEAGLDVEIIDFAGGTTAMRALLGGSADVVSGAYEHTISVQARGQFVQVFVLQGIYPGLALGLKPELAAKYRSPKDLKGLKIGVTAPGSGTHQMVNYLLAKDGLKPTDIAAVGVGSGPGAVAAMQSGEIDGICNIDPVMTQVVRSGHAAIVADARTKAGTESIYGSPLPSASLYAKLDFIERNPETIQALTDAMVKGLKWLHAATPEQLAKVVPPEWLKVNQEFYMEAFRNQREVFSPDGLVPAAGAERQLEIVKTYLPEAREVPIDLSKTYTNRFVEDALKRLK